MDSQPNAGQKTASEPGGKMAFFRQSGWMVMATVGGGAFMMLVHNVAARMDKEEYGVFFALLRCINLLGIPAGGLQTIFAQQTAASLTDKHHSQLAATTRAIMAACFFIWLAVAAIVFSGQGFIMTTLKIHNPAAIWVTMLVVLISLWLPILKGLLQGRQNFMGLGWVAILDGMVRFTTLTIIVLFLDGQAAGAMTGASLGQIMSLCVGIWWCRDIFGEAGHGFLWRPWLQRVVPLTLGTGALLFLSSADPIYIQSIFPADQSPFYAPGALVGFALVQFTVPLAAVMFPKVVRSAARAEKTDALKLTLGTTAVLGVLAATAATLLPKLPLQILYAKKPEFWVAAPLVPWFAWCMLFFTLANVLVNNLLAREKFGIVPWLVALVGAYGGALYFLKERLLTLPYFDAFKQLVQTLGAFNVLLFLVAVWFTWVKKTPAEKPT